MNRQETRSPAHHARFSLGVFLLLLISAATVHAQDWFKTETTSGASTIRIAAADFKQLSPDPHAAQLKRIFDSTLYSDLANAGIFDLVSKSLMPQATPGAP